MVPNSIVSQHNTNGMNVSASDNSQITVIQNFNITELSSSGLVDFSKVVIEHIRHRDLSTAKSFLDGLSSIASLDDECRHLLKILEYKWSIHAGEDIPVDRDLFLRLLKSPKSNEKIREVVHSIFLHFLSRTSIRDANEYYKVISNAGDLIDEVFFEHIAETEVLHEKLATGLSGCYESELCSYVRCALRNEQFELATSLGKELCRYYKNINSEILLGVAFANYLYRKYSDDTLLFLDKAFNEERIERISNCLTLSNKTSDLRVIHIAAILLVTSNFQSPELMNLCRSNILETEKTIPGISDIISHDNNNSGFSIIKDQLDISESDFYKMCPALYEGEIPVHEVRAWLKRGGTVKFKDDHSTDFIKIMLDAITIDPDDNRNKINLYNKIDSFLRTNEIRNFSIIYVYKLCVRLNEIDLHLCTVRLLKDFIPSSPCESPILDVYAKALLQSHKIEQLDSLLSSVGADGSELSFLDVKIERAISLQDYSAALRLTRLGLAHHNDSCYLWFRLLCILDMAEEKLYDIESAISSMPMHILSKYSYLGKSLVRIISKYNFHLASSVMLEWFLDEPRNMAIPVTQLYLSDILNRSEYIDSEYKSNRCSGGVVYTCDKKEHTKILVTNCKPEQYFIEENTVLGQFLQTGDIGSEQVIKFKKYKIIERLPPDVAAFRVASIIREEMNDDSDPFSIMTVDSETGEGVQDFLQRLEGITSRKTTLDVNFLDGHPTCLLFRLQQTHSSDPITGAFSYLSDENNNADFLLYSDGEHVTSSVVIDILAIAYLSITGFCYGLVDKGIKLLITRETQQILSAWIRHKSRSDYMSLLSTESGLTKITASDICSLYSFKNLQFIFEKSELLSPRSADMPDDLVRIFEFFDISHTSSVRVAISNQIPLLCFDHKLCGFYDKIGVLLANAYNLVCEASETTPIHKAHHINCDVVFNLPAPVSHQQLINLCLHGDINQYIAAKFIRKYPDEYSSEEQALRILTECYINSLQSTYLINRDISPYNKHVLFSCCEMAISHLRGNSREIRLAKFIKLIIFRLQFSEGLLKHALLTFGLFISGHFLDLKVITSELALIRINSSNQ